MKQEYNIKKQGQVFTPEWLVLAMLDRCRYKGKGIIGKHLMDNSCGEGAFLVESAKRYIQVARQIGWTDKAIMENLQSFIHGIEKDPDVHATCIKKMDNMAEMYGLKGIKWDIRCGNALEMNDFNGKMDFVVGNPPYVRIHNMDEKIK